MFVGEYLCSVWGHITPLVRIHYSSSDFMKITLFSVKIKQVMHFSDIDVVFLRKFKVEWLTPGNFVAFAKKHLHYVQCNCSIIHPCCKCRDTGYIFFFRFSLKCCRRFICSGFPFSSYKCLKEGSVEDKSTKSSFDWFHDNDFFPFKK